MSKHDALTRRQALIAGAAAAVAASAVPTHAEFQPMMEAALQSLREARSFLRRASPDKGGHRVIALNLIDQAISQVQQGIVFDDTH